jgi:hypothetical protein
VLVITGREQVQSSFTDLDRLLDVTVSLNREIKRLVCAIRR